MKRRIFSCLVFSALIGAGMVSVSSCADYDEDIKALTQIVNNNTTINEALKIQVDGMQSQIDALKAAVESMKSCGCGDIDQKIAEQLAKAIKDKNLVTTDDVAAAINEALKGIQTGLTDAEVKALIEAYHKEHPNCQCGDIETLIEKYLKENPGLIEADVTKVLDQYMKEHGVLNESDVKSIIETYISQLQHFTKEQIESMINTAIAQALAGLSGCNGNCLTSDQVSTIANTVIEQYMKDHPYTLDEAAVKNICETTINNSTIINNIQKAIEELQDGLDEANETLTKHGEDISSLITGLQEANNAITDAMTLAQLAYTKATNNAIEIAGIQAIIEGLSNNIIELNEKVQHAHQRADQAYNEAQNALDELEALEKTVLGTNADGSVKDYPADKKALVERIEALEAIIATLGSIDGDCAATCATCAQTISDLRDGYTGTLKQLADRLDQVESDLTTLESRVEKVENALTKLITNIELQGSTTPAFGYFSLPVGITSNILIAYYGKNEHNTTFPNIEGTDLVYDDPANYITEEDWERIGEPTQWKKAGGSWITGGAGNAGKLYLTVNPSSVDFTNTEFSLVNSLGEESPVKLEPLKPSTDKLTFGQTRGTSAGFYEAAATVTSDKLGSASFYLSEQMNSVLKDISKNTLASNISDIAQAVYNQFNGTLDAYAVQANWTDTDGNTHTVTSKYGIAAAAIKPLSYDFLYGTNFKLPTITPFSEMNIDITKIIDPKKFHFTIDEINTEFNITVDFSDLYIDPSGNIWSDAKVTSGDSYEAIPVMIMSASEIQSSGAVVEDIVKLLNDRGLTWGTQLQSEFKTQLKDNLDKMRGQINDAVAQVSGKLENAVTDVVNNVQNKLNSALSKGDSFIKQLNSLINSINDNLLGNGNPNLRLQSQLFYPDKVGLLHPVSNSKGMPTPLTGTGAIELDISSYTSEILAPAFQKFVAVTNVYKDGQDADSSAELMQALKYANNNANYFNLVIPGDRYGVVFTPDPSVTGATYEIVYSALDYHGSISQRKYYVKVN